LTFQLSGVAESPRAPAPLCARPGRPGLRLPLGRGVPSPSWRAFLTRRAKDIWACDFFGVRTVFFRTLYVFFVMHHETRQILQVRVTRHPTADWTAQQVVDTCGWDRDPPRYLLRDRDSRSGEVFDRRVRGLGVRQLRTPVKAPRANALAERWVRSARTECRDHLFIVDERHLQRVLDEYVVYFNAWRPHHGLGQRALSGSAPTAPPDPTGRIIAQPVLGACIISISSLMVGWSSCALQDHAPRGAAWAFLMLRCCARRCARVGFSASGTLGLGLA
jgi:transposase InsO family protein